eukprot:TRINITY_DN10666_c0_g1_i1.p1 TRINITY_DN10666_c0_g1~~TRINITY_DN10666_c0_g1_i1.p1  ORF type:complete len:229 (-),score=16.36 TRINITY_DN10666_c0_g1_i1:31-717(-)
MDISTNPYIEIPASLGIIITATAVIDFILRQFVTSKNARWFSIHAILNVFVAILSFGDLLRAFGEPYRALDVQSITELPIYIVVGCHIYHMVAFDNLTRDDWIHHIVFVGIIGTSGILGDFGVMTNTTCFFLSGFPGGLDYGMLALVKLGYMGVLTEKDWNARINVWIRGPGCTLCAYIMYVAYKNSETTTWSWYACVILMTLTAGNGQYYMQRVVGNTFRRDKDFQC